MLTPLSVLWTIVAGGSSFTMSFFRDSMSSMRLLWTKCDDAPQSGIMVSFSGPRVAEPARDGTPMLDGGYSMTYGVGAASEVTRVGGGVPGAGGAAGAGARTVGEDLLLAATAVLARPVLEPSP